MSIILGVDPGKKGGLAFLDTSTKKLLFCIPTPKVDDALDIESIADLLDTYKPTKAVIESVHAMPKQGVSSMFTFGFVTGIMHGLTRGRKMRVYTPTPQAWKKTILAGTEKDKDAAIAFCKSVYPDVTLIFGRARTPNDGVADAICLATYGMRDLKL